jgi:DNA-binding CsgD family transcriptional regulator
MSPLIARQLLNRWQERQPDQPMKPKGASWRGDGLSKRELDVLQLVSRGCTYQETAEHLGIKVFTVQAHVRNIYAKLEVHNKAEAIFEARQLGLLG